MLKHIVMWRLKDFAKGNSKETNQKIMKDELLELKKHIQEIISIEVGFNVIESNQSYDVCLYSIFKDEKDLLTYQNHELHQKLVSFIREVVETRVVIDYYV
jgi:hypothetical protein